MTETNQSIRHQASLVVPIVIVAGWMVATSLAVPELTGGLAIVMIVCLVATRQLPGLALLIPALASTFQGTLTWLPYASLLPLMLVAVPMPSQRLTTASRSGTAEPNSLLLVGVILLSGITGLNGLLTPGADIRLLAQLGFLAITAALAVVYFRRFGTPAGTTHALLASGIAVGVAYLLTIGPIVALGGTHVWAGARSTLTWVNPNALGLYFLLVLALPLHAIAAGRARFSTWAGAGVLLGALAMTFSRSAYLGLAAMVLILLARSRRARLLLAPPLILLTVNLPASVLDRIQYTSLGGTLDDSSAVRLDLWRIAWQITLDHPLTGVGPHQLAAEFAAQGLHGQFTFAHNLYLTVLASFGLVAPAILAIALAKRAKRRARTESQDHLAELESSTTLGPKPGRQIPGVFTLAAVAALVCSFFGESILSPVVFVPLIAIGSMRRQEDP